MRKNSHLTTTIIDLKTGKKRGRSGKSDKFVNTCSRVSSGFPRDWFESPEPNHRSLPIQFIVLRLPSNWIFLPNMLKNHFFFLVFIFSPLFVDPMFEGKNSRSPLYRKILFIHEYPKGKHKHTLPVIRRYRFHFQSTIILLKIRSSGKIAGRKKEVKKRIGRFFLTSSSSLLENNIKISRKSQQGTGIASYEYIVRERWKKNENEFFFFS